MFMEGINNNNNTYNSANINIKSKMSVSQVVKEVLQLMFNCGQNVTSRDVEELHQCLPLLQDILSEISNLVMISQQQQQQHSPDVEDLAWDSEHNFTVYSDVASSFC